jgi:pimeloyl-ACP methyl ester carboxylesterase
MPYRTDIPAARLRATRPGPADVRALAALLGNADLALLPRTGHFPWVDDPASFAATVDEFLARRPATPGA